MRLTVTEVKDGGSAWQACRVSDQRFDEPPHSTATDVLDIGPDGPRVWLPLPDVADVLGTEVGKVRRMLQERVLIGMRRGERKILSVPAELLKDGHPLPTCRAR